MNPHTDAAISLTGIELYLQSKGVWTCWAGYLTRFSNEMSELREFLDIPEDRKFYGALMIGYPTEEYLTIPSRKVPDIEYIK